MPKKASLLLLAPLCLAVVFLVLPSKTEAIKFSNFKTTYQGTWENTSNDCGSTGGTGTMTIEVRKVERRTETRARVKKAWVYFSDGVYGGMEATGRIFLKNNRKKMRLNYGAEESGDYTLVGRINKNTFHGTYTHEFLDDTCHWGGTFDLENIGSL